MICPVQYHLISLFMSSCPNPLCALIFPLLFLLDLQNLLFFLQFSLVTFSLSHFSFVLFDSCPFIHVQVSLFSTCYMVTAFSVFSSFALTKFVLLLFPVILSIIFYFISFPTFICLSLLVASLSVLIASDVSFLFRCVLYSVLSHSLLSAVWFLLGHLIS